MKFRVMTKVLALSGAILASASVSAVEVSADTTVSTANGNVSTYTTAETIAIASGVTLTFAPAAGESWTIGAVISGEGGIVVKGADRTGEVHFTGDNTYAGDTSIASGSLYAENDNALGAGGTLDSGFTSIGSNAGCLYLGSGIVSPEAIKVSGGVWSSALALLQSVADAELTGPIMASGTVISSGGGTLTFSGSFTHIDFIRPPATASFVFNRQVTGGGKWYVDHGTLNVIYNASGNEVLLDDGTIWFNSRICAGCDFAFNGYGMLGLCNSAAGTIATFDMQGHPQAFKKITGMPTAGNLPGLITSSEKAILYVYPEEDNNLHMKFTAKAGLCWAPQGVARTLTVSDFVSDTQGDLIVTNGTVSIMSNAGFNQLDNLYLGTDGNLNLEANAVCSTTKFFIDGQRVAPGSWGAVGKSGVDYTSERITGDGIVAVTGYAENSVWEDGGRTTLFSDADNWVEGAVPPKDASAKVEFAASGTAAAIDSDWALAGLVFTAMPASFTLGDTGNHLCSLSVGGIETTSHGTPRTLTADVRISASADQIWDIGENDTLSLQKGLQGSGSVTKKGLGSLTLTGCQSFTGGLDIVGGSVDLFGSLGSSHASLRSGATLRLNGDVTTNSAVWMIESGASIGSATANSVNVFNGAVTMNISKFYLGSGATAVFNDGVNCAANYLYGNIIVNNKPFVSTAGWLLSDSNGGTKTFNVTGSTFPEGWNIWNGGTIVCNAENAIIVKKGLVLGNEQDNSVSVTLDLGGFDQTVGSFSAPMHPDYRHVHVKSVTPAKIRITQADGASSSYAYFEGGAGIFFNGATFDLYEPSSTTGGVEVAGGVFNVKSGAVWANCSEVKVTGGLLAIESDASLGGKKTTDYSISNDGKIDLAEGVNIRVKGLVIDGKLRSGVWGSSASPAPQKDDVHFSGLGVISAGHEGLVLIFR